MVTRNFGLGCVFWDFVDGIGWWDWVVFPQGMLLVGDGDSGWMMEWESIMDGAH